jgi:hypothetical protein
LDVASLTAVRRDGGGGERCGDGERGERREMRGGNGGEEQNEEGILKRGAWMKI